MDDTLIKTLQAYAAKSHLRSDKLAKQIGISLVTYQRVKAGARIQGRTRDKIAAFLKAAGENVPAQTREAKPKSSPAAQSKPDRSATPQTSGQKPSQTQPRAKREQQTAATRTAAQVNNRGRQNNRRKATGTKDKTPGSQVARSAQNSRVQSSQTSQARLSHEPRFRIEQRQVASTTPIKRTPGQRTNAPYVISTQEAATTVDSQTAPPIEATSQSQSQSRHEAPHSQSHATARTRSSRTSGQNRRQGSVSARTKMTPSASAHVSELQSESAQGSIAQSTSAQASAVSSQVTSQRENNTKAATKPTPSKPRNSRMKNATMQIFLDESFAIGRGQRPDRFALGALVGTATGVDGATTDLRNLLYPLGWTPGDEVKASGKRPAAIKRVLDTIQESAAQIFVWESDRLKFPEFEGELRELYPYLAFIIAIWDQSTKHYGALNITIDQREFMTDEMLREFKEILRTYLETEGASDVRITIGFANSKDQLGLQAADFIAHAAFQTKVADQAELGLVRLPPHGDQADGHLLRYTVLGIQAEKRQDLPSPARVQTSGIEQLLQLISSVVTRSDNRLQTLLGKVRNLNNDLIQKLTADKSAQVRISGMPNKSWYDVLARLAAVYPLVEESARKDNNVQATIRDLNRDFANYNS